MARRNNIDMRVRRSSGTAGRAGHQVARRLQPHEHGYVITFNKTFVPDGAWLTPTTIQPARYCKISAQFDF